MKDMNKLILVGRLGADPALRQTKNALHVASFSLATHYRLVSKDAAPEVSESGTGTQWHRVIAWGKKAEWCAKSLSRGDSVFVQGTIRSRTYEKEGGQRREVFEVIADDITLLRKAQPKDLAQDGAVDSDDDAVSAESDMFRIGREYPLSEHVESAVH